MAVSLSDAVEKVGINMLAISAVRIGYVHDRERRYARLTLG
jgi:hypothetical protein